MSHLEDAESPTTGGAQRLRAGRLTDRVVEAGWLVLAAGLPLAVVPWGRNAFELPKAVLLWVTVATMGAAWLVRGASRGMQSLRRSAPGVRAIAWGAVLLLSTLFSANPLQSAQGSYERMQGALTALCHLALFLLVVDRLRTSGQTWRLLRAVAWGGMPVVAYGLLQALGFDPLTWQTEGSPVISTLGRSNFLGGYLVLVLPVTWACARQERGKARRSVYIGWLIAQGICLVATMSRAAWLGAGAAGGVLLLICVWDQGHPRAAAVAACLALIGLLGGLVALVSTPGLTGSLGARGAIWRATWSLVVARPILGYGPETFGQVFTRVYPPELVYLQGRAVLVDRAHNLILDTLVSTGGAGLITYAALIGAALAAGMRAIAQSQDRLTRIGLAAVLASATGYLVETQFGFPVMATGTLFWTMLGVLTGQSIPATSAPANDRENRRSSRPHKVLAASLLVTLLPASAAVLVADVYAGRAQRSATVIDLQHAIAAMEHAIVLWPTQPAYDEHLSWLHLQLAQRGYNPDGELRMAEARLDAALRLTPDVYRLWAGLGELYTEQGRAGDPAGFTRAEYAYRRATALFPGSAMLYTGWGLSYLAQGRIAEATDQFHRAAHLDHTDAWAYWRLGDALLAQDDLEGAEEAYRNAVRWAPGLVGAHRGLGHVYRRRGYPEAALSEYQTAMSLAPDDPELVLDMARCSWDMGRGDLACQVAARGLLTMPGHPDLLAFLAGCP